MKSMIAVLVLVGFCMIFSGCKDEAGKPVETLKSSPVEAIKSKAEAGVVRSQYDLGVCYANGWGVEKDHFQAFYWWSKAAAKGDLFAICDLGNCYEKGNGTVPFAPMAMYYYLLAARQGFAEAQYNLGKAYTDGEIVAKDEIRALYWFTLAALQDHTQAQIQVGSIYEEGKVVERNTKLARIFLEPHRKHNSDAAAAWRRLRIVEE